MCFLFDILELSTCKDTDTQTWKEALQLQSQKLQTLELEYNRTRT